MTGIPVGGKEISVKTLLLTRKYRQNSCNGLTDFAVSVKNNDFSDCDEWCGDRTLMRMSSYFALEH